MDRQASSIPWLRLLAIVLLGVAMGTSVGAGRTGDSILIGVLFVVSLAFVVMWFITWRRGLLSSES